MMLTGRIAKEEGPFWSVEVEAIGAFTQGRSRKDAAVSLVDLVEMMVGRPGFKATVTELGAEADNVYTVLVDSSEPARLAALVLKYQRDRNKLSLADVAKKLGAASRNAYARYEQGQAEPSLSKFRELLAVVAPDMALTIGPRTIGAKRKAARAAR